MALISGQWFTNLLVVYLAIVTSSEAVRILAVFPIPSISHQVVFRPLTQELARRGHEVVVITPDPAFPKGKTPQNLTEIDVHNESYEIWRKIVVESQSRDLITQLKDFVRSDLELFKLHMRTKEVQDLINSKDSFDLLLIEACVRPALAYSHIYKVPVILVSSFGSIPGNLESVGAPVHPTLYANMLRQRTTNLNLWEKFVELCKFYLYEYIIYSSEEDENIVIRDLFGPNATSIYELKNNVHMLFLNVNPVFVGVRPVPPAVVYMGGLHQKPKKELPMPYQNVFPPWGCNMQLLRVFTAKGGKYFTRYSDQINTTFRVREMKE